METNTACRDNGTEVLAAEYEIEQEVHDRRYQAFSLRNEISLEPIDAVSGIPIPFNVLVLIHNSLGGRRSITSPTRDLQIDLCGSSK